MATRQTIEVRTLADDSKDPKFQLPQTAQEAVLTRIRQFIIEGEWQPGEYIRQDRVAGRLGVSHVPVREALRTLEADGLVKYEAHHGYAVTDLTIMELKEIYRIRQLLEGEAIRDASRLLTPEDLRRMYGAMVEMESTNRDDIGSLTAANRRFHFALFEAAQRPRLCHLIRVLWDTSELYRARYYLNHQALDEVLDDHRLIYGASVDKNEGRMLELSDKHRSHAITLLERILD